MIQERWRELEELFHSAMEREPQNRKAWLDEVCSRDDELRSESGVADRTA